MVNTISCVQRIVYAIILSTIIFSCSSDDVCVNEPTKQVFEYTLNLYDTNHSRSEDSHSFTVGDKLYLYFAGDTEFSAFATYQDDAMWHLELNQALEPDDGGSCNVAYTEYGDLISTNNKYYYRLDSKTALYGTQEGKWSYYNGTISVYAHLVPQQLKIQFVSDKETTVMIKGVQPQDYFSVKTYDQWSNSDKYRPCYPQTITIGNKRADGKYTSDNYYFLGLGTSLFGNGGEGYAGCQHVYYYSEYFNRWVWKPCTLGDYIYIYDRQDIQHCYRRSIPADIGQGASLIINVPTPESYDGWEMIDNQISTVENEPESNYIHTDLTNTCGFSVNFSAKKNFDTSASLSVSTAGTLIFRLIAQNNVWANYSAISYSARCDVQIIFSGKYSSDGSDSPYNYYKDITYSHFPYYDECVESWDDY